MELPDDFRAYIQRLCAFLKIEVFAQEWWIDIEYHDELEASDAEKICAASITINDTYLQATLRISAHCYELYQKSDWIQIGRILTHEYCHLLTEPLYRIALDGVTNSSKGFLEEARERQTQRIANVIFNRIPDDIWIPEATKRPKRKTNR